MGTKKLPNYRKVLLSGYFSVVLCFTSLLMLLIFTQLYGTINGN